MPVATRVRSGIGASSSGIPQFVQTAASAETFMPQFGHDSHSDCTILVPFPIRSRPAHHDSLRSFPPIYRRSNPSSLRRPIRLRPTSSTTSTIPPTDRSVRVPTHRHHRRTDPQKTPSPTQSVEPPDEPTHCVPAHRHRRRIHPQPSPSPGHSVEPSDKPTHCVPTRRPTRRAHPQKTPSPTQSVEPPDKSTHATTLRLQRHSQEMDLQPRSAPPYATIFIIYNIERPHEQRPGMHTQERRRQPS
ncbi:hypothetical protein B1400_0342 [Bifidobacterium italicum]|uniref:Uncharacterized protein n=1 Tax=Bifidobacterium italicum TaxID=1960968 RepID=A0A2A2ELD8_9BIFI|nr:hypothetical protein B1400_0342 [Bifidobacterium italicum]